MRLFGFKLFNEFNWGCFGIALALAFLAGCAAQGGPGGGPVDRTGPELVSCYPEDGATGVAGRPEIVFQFSEPLDTRALDNILQVTPRLSTAPRVIIRRRKVIIKLNEPLHPDRTYIFNFGRNLVDYQKNPTAREIKLAFATGDSLDQGVIAGRVSDIPTNSKTEVWFYKKGTDFPDTLWLAEPDFVVSVDVDGNYQATNLPLGEYRALAVSGERPRPKFLTENDWLAPPQVENLSIKNRNDRLDNIGFRLTKMYWKPFRLLIAKPLDGLLELNFSRPLSNMRLTPDNFIFSDARIKVIHAWADEKEATRILLLTDSLISKTEYFISVSGIVAENADSLIVAGRTARFNWIDQPDTLRPKIASSIPAANAKEVELMTVIQVNLSEPISGDTLAAHVELFFNDTLKVPIKAQWIDANSFTVEPQEPLLSATNYALRINAKSWLDYAGNQFQDSLIALRFSTIDGNLFGTVSGKVVTFGDIDPQNLIIEANLTGARSFQRQTRIDSTGFYKLEDLAPGKYTFSIWEDRNNDEQYDFGRLIPYIPAEPYRVYREQINVRSRWETAEVNWEF